LPPASFILPCATGALLGPLQLPFHPHPADLLPLSALLPQVHWHHPRRVGWPRLLPQAEEPEPAEQPAARPAAQPQVEPPGCLHLPARHGPLRQPVLRWASRAHASLCVV